MYLVFPQGPGIVGPSERLQKFTGGGNSRQRPRKFFEKRNRTPIFNFSTKFSPEKFHKKFTQRINSSLSHFGHVSRIRKRDKNFTNDFRSLWKIFFEATAAFLAPIVLFKRLYHRSETRFDFGNVVDEMERLNILTLEMWLTKWKD